MPPYSAPRCTGQPAEAVGIVFRGGKIILVGVVK